MRINEIANPKHNILTESCRGLTSAQRHVVEGIYRDLQPLIEISLTQQQIGQIFTGVEQGATAAGGNRTLIGRGVDVARTVDQTINKVGQWLQNTAPVQAFDQKFETLKGDIAQKFPQLGRAVGQLGDWAKANPGKTAAIVGVLTTIAALGAGPAGGAIAGQILRGTAELLKGERLSTAVGKGLKTAAYGALAGYSINQIGDFIGDGARVVADNLFPGAQRLRMNFDVSGTGPTTFQNVTAVGRPEDVQAVRDMFNGAAKTWQSGDYQRALAMFERARDTAEVLASPEYVAQLTSDQDLARTILAQAKNLVAATDAVAAGAQGAIQAQGAGQKQATSESITPQQINEMFRRVEEGVWDYLKGKAAQAGQAIAGKVSQVGQNLTTKITADKLNRAWKAAGSPTDSDQIFALLKQQGVDGGVLSTVWKQMRLPAPNASIRPGQTARPTAQPAAASAEPATQPQVGMAANKFGNMVQNLARSGTASSTGGTTQKSATGVRHSANPNNPNLAYSR